MHGMVSHYQYWRAWGNGYEWFQQLETRNVWGVGVMERGASGLGDDAYGTFRYTILLGGVGNRRIVSNSFRIEISAEGSRNEFLRIIARYAADFSVDTILCSGLAFLEGFQGVALFSQSFDLCRM